MLMEWPPQARAWGHSNEQGADLRRATSAWWDETLLGKQDTGWTKSQLQVERMVLFWSSRVILCGVSTSLIFPTATSSSRCSSPTLTHTGEKETGVCLLLPILSHLTPVSDLWCWKSSTKSAKNLQLTNCSEQRTDKSLKQSFASFWFFNFTYFY